jgi:hypothetical protein
MALIQLSAIVSDIKGKVGGSTFKGGTGGSHVLQRKSYRKNASTNNVTPAIFIVSPKAAISACSQAWQGLTATQQKSWGSNAVAAPYKNKLGQTKTYSGYVYFMSINVKLAMLGLSIQIIPPPVGITLSCGNVSGSYSVAGGTVNYSQVSVNSSTQYLVVEMTRPLTAGRTAQDSDYKVIVAEIGAHTFPLDVTTGYLKALGAVLTKGTIWVRAYMVDTTHLIPSVYSVGSFAITA